MKASKWTVFSWALYDFASTIFSMNIITLYFVLWVTIDMHGRDIYYSIALSGSMLLAAFLSPLLGSMSDRIGKKMPFLTVLTIAAFIFTFTIGLLHSLLLGLIAFFFANLTYQLGDVFYNALLPKVSNENNTGRVSGLGKSLGYFGSIIGLLAVGPFVLHYGREWAFIPTAILFILFALPCFFLVKEPPTTFIFNKKKAKNVLYMAIAEVHHTLKNIRQYPDLARSLLAIFLGLNTVSTVFIFMSVYLKKVVGLSDGDIQIYYIICSIVAIFGAFLVGVVTDFWGAKRTLMSILILWCVAIVWAGLAESAWQFWIIGPFVGVCLGGVWTSARALVAELAPANMEGEAFGFYGLVNKTSAVIAPLIWGVSVWVFESWGMVKYRITVTILVVFLLLGIWVLYKVPNRVKVHV